MQLLKLMILKIGDSMLVEHLLGKIGNKYLVIFFAFILANFGYSQPKLPELIDNEVNKYYFSSNYIYDSMEIDNIKYYSKINSNLPDTKLLLQLLKEYRISNTDVELAELKISYSKLIKKYYYDFCLDGFYIEKGENISNNIMSIIQSFEMTFLKIYIDGNFVHNEDKIKWMVSEYEEVYNHIKNHVKENTEINLVDSFKYEFINTNNGVAFSNFSAEIRKSNATISNIFVDLIIEFEPIYHNYLLSKLDTFSSLLREEFNFSLLSEKNKFYFYYIYLKVIENAPCLDYYSFLKINYNYFYNELPRLYYKSLSKYSYSELSDFLYNKWSEGMINDSSLRFEYEIFDNKTNLENLKGNVLKLMNSNSEKIRSFSYDIINYSYKYDPLVIEMAKKRLGKEKDFELKRKLNLFINLKSN